MKAFKRAKALSKRVKKDLGVVKKELNATAELISKAQQQLQNEGDIIIEDLFAALEPHRLRVKEGDASWEKDRQLYCKSKDQLDQYSRKLDGYAKAIDDFEKLVYKATGGQVTPEDFQKFRSDVIECSVWNGRHGGILQYTAAAGTVFYEHIKKEIQ